MQYPLPPGRPERRIWRWYRSTHPLTQIGLGCLTLLFVLFLCSFGMAAAPYFVQGFTRSFQHTPVPNNVRVVPDVTSVVGYSHAVIGGTLNDFIVQYGKPTKTTSNSDMFITNDNVQITAYANGTVVNQISVLGPNTWTTKDALSFCQRYLPDDAQEVRRSTSTPIIIDYRSRIGQISMQLQETSCLLLAAFS